MTHRRENGLPADSYVPLAPLPPPRADRLLEALRRAGIAAYAVPRDVDDHPSHSEAAQAPTGGEPTPDPGALAAPHPAESVDRVYVDSEAIASARDILRRQVGDTDADFGDDPVPESPEVANSGADEEWRDLVARFYESAGDAPAWPDAENLDPQPDDAADDDAKGKDAPAEAHDPGEEHYVPPPPPPIPSGTLVSRLAWAAVLGGPALAVVMVIFLGQDLPPWLGFCIVAGFISGFVVLVVRMEDRPSRTSDPDDGAVT